MTKTIDALVEALEELLYADTEKARSLSHAALALARAEQAEPVAEVREDKRSGKLFIATLGDAELEPGTKLYTAPPAAPAKLEPLTEVEVQRLIAAHGSSATPSEDNNYTTGDYPLLRAVEAAHNAKLGGA